MSIFSSPKPPRPVPAAAAPVAAVAPAEDEVTGSGRAAGSLITTGSQGLRRKPNTQRGSLIGGS